MTEPSSKSEVCRKCIKTKANHFEVSNGYAFWYYCDDPKVKHIWYKNACRHFEPQTPVSAPEKCPDLTPEVKKLFHYSKRLADYVRLWMENGLNAGKIGDESGNSLWVPYRDLMEELKAFANADKEKL